MFIDFNAEDHPHLPPQIACEMHEEQDASTGEKGSLIRKNPDEPGTPPVYTTMALGEEGGDDKPELHPKLPQPPQPPEEEETFEVTTLAVGEEG